MHDVGAEQCDVAGAQRFAAAGSIANFEPSFVRRQNVLSSRPAYMPITALMR